MAIRYLDLFAGIGGFRSGLEAVGGFDCVGFCEIDPYAKRAYEAMYDTKGEQYFSDVRTIQTEALPHLDLICGGFPCQSFSIAGKRGGFADVRGTLFFEIARLAAACRPAYLLLENVPGLLSHDQGRTFAAILNALDELGYDVTWQVLNSKDFGVPQSRKRVYIIGYIRDQRAGEILFFTETNGASLIQSIPGPQGSRVYSAEGVSCTLTSEAGGFGGRSGLYDVGLSGAELPIKVNTKLGYQLALPGDSIDLAYPNQNSRRGRVGREIAYTLTTGSSQGCYFIDMNEDPDLTDYARCITARQDSGISTHKRERSAVFVESTTDELDSPFAFAIHDRQGRIHYGRVRKLLPLECWRLQGFTDEQFYKAQATGLSDARLYKMAGNAVTVPVISAVGQKIWLLDEKYHITERGREG